MNFRFRTLLLSGALLSAAVAPAQEVFRWVDKDGVVHYGDSPPPEYAEQMFEDRVPVVDPEDVEAAKRAQADTVLLQTYLSVVEIETVRDQRIEILQYQDRLTLSYLSNLNRQLDDLESAAEEIGADTSDVGNGPDANPASTGTSLNGEIGETRRQIGVYRAELVASEAEQAKLKAKFDEDIARFKQLTAATPEG